MEGVQHFCFLFYFEKHTDIFLIYFDLKGQSQRLIGNKIDKRAWRKKNVQALYKYDTFSAEM